MTGSGATRAAFLAQIARPVSAIHLATHVLVPEDRRESGSIVFGLSTTHPAGQESPQFLSTPEITALHVPGALVVMSGCSTGLDDPKAGAGLLGLTRAWLMAGATAVITTGWPVEDSSGEIFARFYGFLASGDRGDPASALQHSQIEMIRSGRWLASPSYWASYEVTGGARR